MGADAGGGGCAPANLEALLRGWSVLGGVGSKVTAESEGGRGRGGCEERRS